MMPWGQRFIAFATLCGGITQGAFSALANGAEFCVTCEGPAAQYTCKFDDSVTDSSDPKLKLYCITELARSGPHASCSVDRARLPPCAGIVRMLSAPQGLGIGGLDIETKPDAVTPDAASGSTRGSGAETAAPVPFQQPGTVHNSGVDSAPDRAAQGAITSPAGGTASAPNGGSTMGGVPDSPSAAPQVGGKNGADSEAPATEDGATGKSPEFSNGQPPKTVEEMVEKSTTSTNDVLKKTGEAATNAATKTGSAIQKAGKAVGSAAQKTWHCITSLFGDC